MSYRPVLGDSNVLVYLTNQDSQFHHVAARFVAFLEESGALLLYTSQNLAEFWNVCTRPVPSGLGLSIEDTVLRIEKIERRFLFLPETESTDRLFKDLLLRYRVRGIQVHDARLAAVMLSSGVKEIATFDKDDFRRFTELTVIHPQDISS